MGGGAPLNRSGDDASRELFLAVAAERTRHIRLGTGAVSLPYHHPLMVADRIILLDHLTRGRINFGVRWLSGGGFDDAQFRRTVDLFDERKAVPTHLRPKAVWATAAGDSDRLAFAVETLEESS